MIILSWNVRGLNESFKHKQLNEEVNKHKPNIFALAETKVKEHNSYITLKLFPSYSSVANYASHYNGGICLFWRQGLILSPLHVSC